jgi:hypothetical protein
MIVNDELEKIWKQSIMAYFKTLCQHLSEGTVRVASFRAQIFSSTTARCSIQQCQNSSPKQVDAANLDDKGSIRRAVLLGTAYEWMLHSFHTVKRSDFKNVRIQTYNFAYSASDTPIYVLGVRYTNLRQIIADVNECV